MWIAINKSECVYSGLLLTIHHLYKYPDKHEQKSSSVRNHQRSFESKKHMDAQCASLGAEYFTFPVLPTLVQDCWVGKEETRKFKPTSLLAVNNPLCLDVSLSFMLLFPQGSGFLFTVFLQAIIISESFWSSHSLKKPIEKDILNNSITYFDRDNLGWENCCFLAEDLFIYLWQILLTELRWS